MVLLKSASAFAKAMTGRGGLPHSKTRKVWRVMGGWNATGRWKVFEDEDEEDSLLPCYAAARRRILPVAGVRGTAVTM